MAVFKCKMCGGTLEINSETVATCEFCGTQQTLPKLSDDRRANLYDRANHFRRNNEFDKAMGIYEQILNDDNTDAESYWSLVLCHYGIEYVEDPATHKRVPTVNRAQFTSIFDDDNYKSALQYADVLQRNLYEAEAKAINEIQKGILAISQKEEPFDVFICYKETDRNGRRTPDSVLANELYHQLTQEGFKVFFSRITLEDKLGVAYEPYIFAALNSAKVMVVLGTKQEYFNAVWVKNEWSRYLSLIKNGAKKILIPAYRDMDPYDLPEEFSHLQAQDMSKLGFMQDLIRGIKKLAQVEESKQTVVKETVITAANANTAPLLKRAFMCLEDEEWDRADEFCEQVLNIDPECAQAYLGKLMADLHVSTQEELKNCDKPFDNGSVYRKIIRFGDGELKAVLAGYIQQINTRNELARKEGVYVRATSKMADADNETSYLDAAKYFDSIAGYKDATTLAAECRQKAEELRLEAERKAEEARAEAARKAREAEMRAKEALRQAEIARKDGIYDSAKNLMNSSASADWEKALAQFQFIAGWKDADDLAETCKTRIPQLQQEEAECLAAQKQREAEELAARQQKEAEEKAAAEAKAKKKRLITAIVTPILTVLIVVAVIVSGKAKKQQEEAAKLEAYHAAVALANEAQYAEAIEAFAALGDYKDSAEQLKLAEIAKEETERSAELEERYNYAVNCLALPNDQDSQNEAYRILMELGNYKDAKEMTQQFKYRVISERMEILGVSDATEKIYKYNNRGLLVQKEFLNGNEDVAYTYDDNGRVIKEIKNESYPVTECWYNDNGTRKRTVTKTSVGTVTTDFDANGSPVKVENTYTGSTWKFDYTYSESGDIDTIECFYKESGKELTASFNLSAFGENLKLSHALEDNIPVFKSLSADGKDEVTFIIVYDSFKEIQLIKRFIREYDSYGNLTKETQVDGVKDAGSLCSNRYDENGNLIQVVKSYLTGMQIQYDFTYGYMYCPDAK